MSINQFVINKSSKSIAINFTHGDTACLSFEYLRVFTPSNNNLAKQGTLVTHKKEETLSLIENLGKHGYRFIFDDQHSAIYSEGYLTQLIQEYEQRWQHYQDELKASGHSREALINIKQL
jgi:DUF971 family protein